MIDDDGASQERAVSREHMSREQLTDRRFRQIDPQIFIDERSIGGYDELAALERRGELDALLG